MNTCQEWIDYIYTIHSDGTIGKLSPLASFVMKSSQNGDLSLVDEVLEKIDVNKAQTISLVALSRYTYSMNQFLKNWFSFRDRCFERLILTEGEEKAKRLMRGILDNKIYKPIFPEFETHILRVHPSLSEQRNKKE